MRIERIELDGFGRFHETHWALDPGLTIFVGANEAGKTTLLNALRALLFGFEASRDGRTWYPAMAGGRRGGRLILRTASDERWTVERHGERGGAGALAVRAPNGNQGGQETLDRLLHGADRDLFNNIFAFGLGELQTFASLSADGVRGRIYGAGAGLGGTSAVDLERRLRQQQEAVFLPRGRERPLNALLARVETLRAEVADLARQPEEYEAAHRERAELRATADALRDEARHWRERAIRLSHLRVAAPLVAELGVLEEELAGGDASLDALPADAGAMLDRRAGELAEARALLAAIDEELDAARRAFAAVEVDEPILGLADEVAALRDERIARRAAGDRLHEVEAAAARHAASVEEQLARAGGWDEARLLALDDSIAAVEATREHERRLADLRSASLASEQRRRSVADELEAHSIRSTSSGTPHDDLDDRSAALRELDTLRTRQLVAGKGGRPARVSGRTLATTAVLVLAGLLAGHAFGQPLLGALAGSLAAAVGVLLLRRQGAIGLPADAAERDGLLARAGLPRGADDAAIDALRDELASRRARREIERERDLALETRRADLARLERESGRAADDVAAAERAWTEWLEQRGLPPGLSPEAARQLLAAAGAARRAAAERDGQRALMEAQRADDDAHAARVDDLLRRLDRPAARDAARREAAVAGLLERLDRARDARRTTQELEASIARHEARRAPAAGVVQEREGRLSAYLASVGCADVDELRRRDQAAAARRALQAQARELRARLAGVAGGAEAVEALVAEARPADAATIEAQHVEARAELERVEAEERACLNRIGAVDARIRQLEVAEELGARRQELASLEGQAAALAREWAVRAIALGLLQETRARYERERQPDVVRAASGHFERITHGRYVRIVAPPGELGVRVETEGGESRVTDELSRGTAEQLYLALRFGLIEEFARHAEPLPVVMDDILVNFDADRAARAAGAIGDLAARHQVIYFTCHPWTATLLDPEGTRTFALG